MNNHDLWINKYKPLTLNKIIGNANQIKNIKEWITNLSDNKSQGIIISGNQGLGKTLTIKLLLNELNFIPRIINPNEIKDHRILDDFNDYYNFVNSVYSKINFNDNKTNKIALIFDETENITLTSEKKYIMDIFKNNNKITIITPSYRVENIPKLKASIALVIEKNNTDIAVEAVSTPIDAN